MDGAGFIADYEESLSEAAASVLLPPIEAVLARTGLMPLGWAGMASALSKRRDQVCGETERKQKWFLENASPLCSALNRAVPLLRLRRIEFHRCKAGRGRDRWIVLRCTSKAAYDELRAWLTGNRCGGEQPSR